MPAARERYCLLLKSLSFERVGGGRLHLCLVVQDLERLSLERSGEFRSLVSGADTATRPFKAKYVGSANTVHIRAFIATSEHMMKAELHD